MSWERSDTEDVLYGTRKLILSVTDGIEQVMDVLDPNECRRYGYDRNGEPLEADPDELSIIDFLFLWQGKLRRANSALHELTGRLMASSEKGESGCATS